MPKVEEITGDRRVGGVQTINAHEDTLSSATVIYMHGFSGGSFSGLTTGTYTVYGSHDGTTYEPLSETVRASDNSPVEKLVQIVATTGNRATLPSGAFGVPLLKLLGVTVTDVEFVPMA